MSDNGELTRRRFLYGSAVAASVVTLAACSGDPSGGGGSDDGSEDAGSNLKGSESKPLSAPGKYKESPDLAKLVEAGELPPVDERLPEVPYVIPHRWVTNGNYGGRLQMIMNESDSPALKEYQYGHSLLRFLNDGLDIGPGLAEAWESNDDATEWVFHFRKGLKWSDGQPWSTEDIMYWWDDMVQNKEMAEVVPPDDVRSGRDTVAKVVATDETTLTLTFDAPAPITPERLAAWVNSATRDGSLGPLWMLPKHYMKQFHPKYNKQITKEDWFVEHGIKGDFGRNPECPTMTGWKLKSYREGRSVVFERNPYYWCVDKSGAQLPYINELQFNIVLDDEVQKLNMGEGKVDYVHGGHHALVLGDVSGFKDAEKRTGVRVWYWDSGSGTGSILFWNQDYPEPGMRELIRDKRFRQALSHAYNREDTRKAIYFNTGELTTGTLSSKGVIFNINDEGKSIYKEWRDSYVKYDPEKAKAMLDDIGVVDKDGDGKREMPDGSKLEMFLDYPADANDEHKQKNEHIKRDWEAVGITTKINPVSPEAFGDLWGRGELMTTTAWEVGDNQPLVYPGWVIPVETGHWAPLHGEAFILQTADPGKLKSQEKLDPWKRTPPWMLADEGDPIDRLWKLYAQARVEADEMKRTKLLWDVCKIHIEEGPFLIGCVANYPRIVLVREGLNNVPNRPNLALGGWVNPWIQPSPAVYDPEAYFWDKPEEHNV